MCPIKVIISGPSGVGKDTVISKWQTLNPKVKKVISYTTRSPRENETDGMDYHFVTNNEFDELVSKDVFIDHRMIFGNKYGLAKNEFEGDKSDEILVANIDVEGALKVSAIYSDVIKIFLLPSRLNELRKRLEKREGFSIERLTRAEKEIQIGKVFDHKIVNNSVRKTVHRIERIVSDFKP